MFIVVSLSNHAVQVPRDCSPPVTILCHPGLIRDASEGPPYAASALTITSEKRRVKALVSLGGSPSRIRAWSSSR